MDPQKVKDIVKWGAPTTLTGVWEFLGFANFYCQFIKGYSQVIAPMINLPMKNQPFVWDSDCTRAFEFLKTAFTTAPVLAHFDPDREILVETDASEYVSAGVMSQHNDNGILYPVAFFSTRHTPAKCNYEIYNKEFMTIIRYFKEWRAELESMPHHIQVVSDHRNVEYFMSTELLNRR